MKLFSKSNCSIRYQPEAIVEIVRKNTEEKERMINVVIEDLCKCKYFENTIYRFVLNNGGSRLKAEEVIEEGLIKLCELIRIGKYAGGKLESFAIQICKNLWLNMRRKKDEQLQLTDDLLTIDRPEYSTPESQMTMAERTEILGQVLRECLSESCRQILHLKLVEGKRHEAIAQLLGLANANSSKEKLNRCKKSALNCIEKNSKYDALMKSVDFFVKKKIPHGNRQLQ